MELYLEAEIYNQAAAALQADLMVISNYFTCRVREGMNIKWHRWAGNSLRTAVERSE